MLPQSVSGQFLTEYGLKTALNICHATFLSPQRLPQLHHPSLLCLSVFILCLSLWPSFPTSALWGSSAQRSLENGWMDGWMFQQRRQSPPVICQIVCVVVSLLLISNQHIINCKSLFYVCCGMEMKKYGQENKLSYCYCKP